jgi:hypothetical protein
MVNEKPTNALIIEGIGTQCSPTCFGSLKCCHQGVKHDPADIVAQCNRKRKRMGAVYCNRRRPITPSSFASHDIGHLSQQDHV